MRCVHSRRRIHFINVVQGSRSDRVPSRFNRHGNIHHAPFVGNDAVGGPYPLPFFPLATFRSGRCQQIAATVWVTPFHLLTRTLFIQYPLLSSQYPRQRHNRCVHFHYLSSKDQGRVGSLKISNGPATPVRPSWINSSVLPSHTSKLIVAAEWKLDSSSSLVV